MNISSAAKKALIPVEREIMFQPVEHLYQLNNQGKVIIHLKGNTDSVNIKYMQDNLISTHNHPEKSYYNNFLSTSDIICAIKLRNREVRAITQDGYCHLAEIPEMDFFEKFNCQCTLIRYKDLFKKEGYSWSLIRKMKKEIEKAYGIKFRTILLPKN